MPSRPVFLALLLLWFAALGWQFAVVAWPVLRAGDPPGAGISLSDETTASAPARYRVFYNGQEIALARLQLTHQPATETFQSLAEFTTLGLKANNTPSKASILGASWLPAKSSLDVDRSGQPQAASAQVKIPTGEVNTRLIRQGGNLIGSKTIQLAATGDTPLPAQPLTISIGEGRAVLGMLLPAWRWNGLRPGQRWSARLLDPLADSLLPANQAHSGQGVACEVAALLEIPPEVTKETECWKIMATREDLQITVWAAVQSGKVMRQEVKIGSGNGADLWVLIREDLLPS